MSLRIIFMGTPEFAVPSLDRLVNAGYNIVGVVTAPDKPAGRGMQLTQSAIKKYAIEKGLLILQPEKLKNPDFLDQLKSLNADLQIVVAFRMLPEAVWNMPHLGTVNLHGSLLPQYRGAAPINWAIINGEKQTGVTTFKLKHEIDTGNILMQQVIDIDEEETAGELHDRMKEIGADLLLETVNGLSKNILTEKTQDSFSVTSQQLSNLKHAPKIFTETCKINWNDSMNTIFNLVRGLSPYPAAFTQLGDKTLKVYKCQKEASPEAVAGETYTDKKTFLRFGCTDGFISIIDLQLQGKKRMLIGDFLRGYKF